MFDHNMCLLGVEFIMRDVSSEMFFDDVKECLRAIDFSIIISELNQDIFTLGTSEINNFLWNNYKKICKLDKVEVRDYGL